MRKLYSNKTNLLAITVFLCAANAAHADVIYQLAVNTSSIAGTNGSIDFQFNAADLNPTTQAATVRLSNFAGGTLGSASNFGEVSGGPLPATVTIGNGIQTSSNDNELFETFKYGSSLTFTLDFGGPAVTAPNGASLGSSLFSFSMFSDANGTVPVLTSDPNGVAATVTVSPEGSATGSAISPNASFVPEPGSVALIGSALALLIAAARKRLINRVG